MANALFTAYKQNLLGLGTRVDLDAPDDMRLIAVDHADDTPVPATDDFLDDIGGAAIVGTATLAGEAILAAGAFDSTDPVFTALTGDQFESLVLYKHTGTGSTSNLLAFYDTATGLPFTPSGGDVTVVVHASGWFSV